MVEAMEIKEGFKKTEVGVIPSDWDYDEIQYLAGITTGAKNTQDRVSDGAYPFFVRSQTVERINSYSYDGVAVLTAGDGVGTGKVFHYIDGKFDFHQRVYKISEFTERLDGYFFYLYFSKNFYNRIMQMTAKSSVDSVRREMIAKMLIPLPTKTEQTTIATALNDADALIAQLEKLIAKKRAIKQGAMQELLKPKEGWEVKKLKEVFKFLKTANNSRADLLQDGEFEYIHYGDIHTKWNSFLYCSKNILPFIPNAKIKSVPFLQEGDLIVADASEDYEGLGACIEIKNIGKQKIVAGLHTMLLRGDKEIMIDGFKGYFRNFHGVKEALIASSTGVSVYQSS